METAQRKRSRAPADLEQPEGPEDEEEHQEREHQEKNDAEQSKPRKRRSPSWRLRVLTFKDLQQHFDKPLHVAAKILGVSDNGLKKICRERQIERWPYREIQGLRSTISHLEDVISKSSSVQERRKIHELLTTLQDQERHLFDTGKCRVSTAALGEKLAAAESSARAAVSASSGRLSSTALPDTSGAGGQATPAAQHRSSCSGSGAGTGTGTGPGPSLGSSIGTGTGSHLKDKSKHAGESNDAGESDNVGNTRSRSAGIDAAPLPTLPPATSDCFGDPQFQQLMLSVLEQLTRITDAQRSLAARITRLESLLDDPYKHRESVHASQPGVNPTTSLHAQAQPHPRVPLNRNVTYPVDLASAATFGGVDGQLRAFLQYGAPSNVVPPSLSRYAAATHHLAHPPFL